MSHKQQQHPYGTTLLSRDTPENRALWGPDGVGYVDVAPSVCTAEGASSSSSSCPYYNYRHDADAAAALLQTPIHLLIASFRDQLCPRTLHNAFRRAENADRIFIRLVEQTVANSHLIDDDSCWERYCRDYNPTGCMQYKNQVRVVHVDATQSKGPTDARSKLSAMIHWDYVHSSSAQHSSQQEQEQDHYLLDFVAVDPHDFCMQIDSHMDFSDHYDTQLVLMHHRTENDYAVLSTYVADISQNNQQVKSAVPNLCMVTFTSSTIRNWGTKECRNLVKPKLTNAMWGAGLSFHRCHAELNVPVDPYLDNVFDGEEGSRGIRFFTHGYDVYTPDVVLVTHDYNKHQSNPVVHSWGTNKKKSKFLRKTMQQEEKNEQEELEQKEETAVWPFMEAIEAARQNVTTVGTERVNMLLGIGSGTQQQHDVSTSDEVDRIRNGRFGLGTKRTLEQAIEFTGIDLREKKMVKNKCGNLVWVPFVEDDSGDYGVSQVLARGLAGGSLLTNQQPNNVASPQNRNARVALKDTSGTTMTTTTTTTTTHHMNILAVGCGLLLIVGVLLKLVTRPRKDEKHTN